MRDTCFFFFPQDISSWPRNVERQGAVSGMEEARRWAQQALQGDDGGHWWPVGPGFFWYFEWGKMRINMDYIWLYNIFSMGNRIFLYVSNGHFFGLTWINWQKLFDSGSAVAGSALAQHLCNSLSGCASTTMSSKWHFVPCCPRSQTLALSSDQGKNCWTVFIIVSND